MEHMEARRMTPADLNAKLSAPIRALVLLILLGASMASAGPREDFLKLIDRPRVELAPKIDSSTSADGLTESHFSFAADSEQRVPGIVVKSDRASGKSPVVIVLHGTG